jgi:hypothetical protein
LGVRSCESRGQVWSIDETTMTARLDLDAPLGVYAFAFGSAQLLEGGGLHFNSGIAGLPGGGAGSLGDELTPMGSGVRALLLPDLVYRSWRLRDLVSAPPGP